MRTAKRLFCLICIMTLFSSSALAAKKKEKATPVPHAVPEDIIQQIPDPVQNLLDLALQEMESGAGKELKYRNKYTDWNGSKTGYGWCGGFITWCALQAGITMETKNKIKKGEVSGVFHVREAGVGKIYTGYDKLNRLAVLPQKGFIVVFGNGKKFKGTGVTPYYHVGLIYDVQKLENGKYRITTIEGNVSVDFTYPAGERHKATHTIRMYTRDFDPALLTKKTMKSDLSLVPEEERTEAESATFSYGYTYGNEKMYISSFLMTWLPEEYASAE